MMYKINEKKALLSATASVSILFCSILFENHSQMAVVFTVPFFSGAANTPFGGEWRFAPKELLTYKYLPTGQQESYRFGHYPDSELMPYSHYNAGLVYLIKIAKKVFFWQGDVRALKSLQVLAHTLICLLFLNIIEKRLHQILFLIGYGLNPLVIHFVTFPYLYFWQVLPSVAVGFVLLRHRPLSTWQATFLGVLCGVAFVTRPTVIFCVFLFFCLIVLRYVRRIAALVAILSFATVFFLFWQPSTYKTAWHTAYIGIGAYPNPHMDGLTDNNAFNLFKEKTGQELYVHPGGNYFDSTTFAKNVAVLKAAYFDILNQSPLLILRNATLNFFQAFSIGYLVDYSLALNYVSVLVGFVVFCVLLFNRQYLWIISIAFASLSFLPYFPPIPAYMFGGYLLIALALIETTKKVLVSREKTNDAASSKSLNWWFGRGGS